MKWFATIIIFSAVLIPTLLLKSYLFPWDEGVAELEKVYPSHSYIEVGWKTRKSITGSLKWRDYLLVPGFQIVRVSKEEITPISVRVKNEHGLLLIGTGLLFIGGLLMFVAIPYVRKNGIFPS